MKNFFKNMRDSVKNLVEDVKQKGMDFVDRYRDVHEQRRESFKESVISVKNRVKSAFSSAMQAVADANGRYEYAMARPMDIPTVDHYGRFEDAIKNNEPVRDTRERISRSDIIGSRAPVQLQDDDISVQDDVSIEF